MKKVKYCTKCKKKTVYEFIEKKPFGDATGIQRIVLALSSFGCTETIAATKYWQCQCCGEVIRE